MATAILLYAVCAFGQPPQMPAASTSLPTYRIGPGDVIDIRVVDSDEWNLQVEVRPDGRITYPATGEIAVAGMTIGQLTKELTHELGPGKHYLKDPVVIINVVQRRPLMAHVLGEVGRPGPVELPLGFETAKKLLSMVGGPTPQADVRHARIYRAAGTQDALDLKAEFDSGHPDTTIYAGDVVTVPRLDVVQVGVLGSVGHAGPVVLEPGQTKIDLLALLVQAGGLSQEADKSDATILRANGAIEPVVLADALRDKAHAPQFGNGDALWVRPKEEAHFEILGAVGSQGRYPYQAGLKLGDALAVSGQLSDQADVGNVLLLHADGTREVVDLRPMINGEHPEIAKMPLRAEDIVLVPRRERSFVILGGVQKPGVFVWAEHTKLADALALAGGPAGVGGTTGADMSRVMLVRRTEEAKQPIVMELDAQQLLQGRNEAANVTIQPNDVIYVPTRETRAWQDKLALPSFLLGIASNMRFLFTR